MEFPMLKRNWEKDKSCLAELSARLSDYPVNLLVSLNSYHMVEKFGGGEKFVVIT